MTPVKPPLLGLCSWSTQPGSIGELVERLRDTGLAAVQLALDPLREHPGNWRDTGDRLAGAGVALASGMFVTLGEDYSTPQTIRRTGGIVPDKHWEANWANAQANAEIARELGLGRVSFHAGFIPEDPADPKRGALVQRVRELADLFERVAGASLLLETGQETAEALGAFLDEVGRPTVGVNFDPANMLLYGMGDPIEALGRLMPRVRQVHVKDALPPAEPGQWGTEVVVGRGGVDWPAFFELVLERRPGPVMIEREAGDDRVGDIRLAAEYVRPMLEGRGDRA